MKSPKSRLITCFLFILLVSGYTSSPRSEAQMVRDVRAALRTNRNMDSSGIVVIARGAGRVELSGQIQSERDRTSAIDVASRLPGIHVVIDRMTLASAAISADVLIQSRTVSNLGQDPKINPQDVIAVNVSSGHVDLGGIVDTWAQHRSATHDAFKAGAVTVLNHIRVRQDPKHSTRGFYYTRDPIG